MIAAIGRFFGNIFNPAPSAGPSTFKVYDYDGALVLHMVDGYAVSLLPAPTDAEHDALVAKFEDHTEQLKGKVLVSRDRLVELTTAIAQGMKTQADQLAAIEAHLNAMRTNARNRSLAGEP